MRIPANAPVSRSDEARELPDALGLLGGVRDRSPLDLLAGLVDEVRPEQGEAREREHADAPEPAGRGAESATMRGISADKSFSGFP